MSFTAVVSVLLLVAPGVSIMEIQGVSHFSPFLADSVVTTGVVTRLAPDGFYLQDASGDGDDATSDAVFVRGNATVFVGDEVRISGIVDEYLPGNDTANFTITEITNTIVTRLRAGLTPPAPVCITRHRAGTTVAGAILFYESLEAMRACVHSPRVTQPSDGASVRVVPHDATLSARGAAVVEPGDTHPERVKLVADGMPSFGTGDVLSDVTGVMSYRDGNYELMLDALPAKQSGHLSREISTLASSDGRVRIASFNLRNLGGDDVLRMDEVARLIVSQLGAPEIIGLQEVVDDSGSDNNGMVDATLNLRALVGAIRAADGPAYDFREVRPENGADGGAPGNNIRVALLFDRARVTFVDRGDSFGDAATRVVAVDGRPQLTRSPGRIDPANPAWVASRKPLACELRAGGETLFIVVCHFVSKSRSSPRFGAVQPPVDPDLARRRRQAELVRDFVNDALAIEADARIVVLGDLNDDWFSAPVAALETALTDLWSRLPAGERYSILYDGSAQAFDHVLVSPVLADDARFDVVHVAAEFPGGVSDHDPVVASITVATDSIEVDLALSFPRPNPFNRTVTLDVSGSRPMSAAIFDVTGHRIRTVTVLEGVIEWDGKDDAGRRAPAGVYFVRVSDGVSTRARKIVLLR